MSKKATFDKANIGKVFDEKQSEVLVNLHQDVEEMVETRTKKVIEDMGLREEDINLAPRDRHLLQDQKRLEALNQAWRNNGRVPGCKERLSLKDLMEKDVAYTKTMRDNFSTDHPLLIPRVISNIAKEAIEPALVLTPLLQRVNFTAGTQVVFPAWGAITAADIPEGGEYPERSLELGGTVTATIGKSGVAVKVTEEMVRYSQFDVMGAHFRAAGRALARWKERKVVDMILQNGTYMMYGDSTTNNAVRRSTGRNAGGAYNGTLTLDDLFWCYSYMVNRGFTPNTIIMHPFGWKIFAQEGIARAFGFINGVNPLMWQAPKGSPGNAPQWRGPGLNNNTYVSSPQQLATTFTNVPSIFPTNFNIIVTPFMPFTGDVTGAASYTTIVFCDVNELGVLVVDEDVKTEEWNDPARDIMKVKFRERYGLALMNEGRAVGILENIVLARSFDFADNIVLSFGTGDLANQLTGDNY